MLFLQNASARRGETLVLHDLTWALQPGEHWAVLGGNGSGKTTLLQVLAGRVPLVTGTRQVVPELDPGCIELVANQPADVSRLATGTGFYQQRFHVYAAEESPTVRDWLQNQVRPAGTIHAASVPLPPPAYAADWLAEVARRTRLDGLLDRRLVQLSTGETRRALLARSLLRRPRVLLLDNPFAGLDAESRRLVPGLLAEIVGEGQSLVVVTSPTERPDCLTHVVELEKGRIRWQGRKANFSSQIHKKTVLISPEAVARFEQSTSWPDFAYAIRMRNVTVRYGAQTVLDGLTWAVRRGERWAVLGPNGSGKSTLLSLVTADHPQGYANDFDLFDRKRGTGESIWEIKARIGLVSSELHAFFPRQTPVWKVVASGLFDATGLYRRLRDDQTRQVRAALDLLGLGTWTDWPLARLSLGQQRWVLLARALVKNPPLLILDEPVQGLDAEHAQEWRALVDSLATRSERTVLYVSHYADELPTCLTHTLRLGEGEPIIC